MRLSKVFTLLEQADPNKIYVVGDSHAVAMSKNISGAVNLARNGAPIQQIAAQAQSVPDGSRVLLTGGANDIAGNHNAAGAGVTKIIRGLKKRNCSVVYVAFPPIDLNGEFADVYREAGYTSQYNRVQQATANAAKAELGANNVAGLSMGDISPADPQAIHATPQAYSRVAQKGAKLLASAPKKAAATGEVTDPRLTPVELEGFSKDEMAALDVDGDGKVTTGDLSDIGVETSLFATGDDFFGIFGVLMDYMNKTKTLKRSSPRMDFHLQRAAQIKSERNSTKTGDGNRGVGSTSNAQIAYNYFISQNISPIHAAALVGNLQAESGANIDPSAVGDNGNAWGIAQWWPDRRQNWEKWKRSKWRKDGTNPGFEGQLEFIIWELNRTESRARKQIMKTKSVADAAFAVDKFYERSSGAHTQRRIDNALAIYEKFAVA
jgi:hypothetical protein